MAERTTDVLNDASTEPTLTGAARLRAIIARAPAGNLVEWYDFYVYSFTSLYFASSSSRATIRLRNC